LDPFLVRFPRGWFIEGIRWYGFFYLLSFIFAFFALNFYTAQQKSPFSRDQNSSFLSYLIAGVMFGGRVGYMLLYCFDQFIRNPLEVFAIWHGGMSSHGGFIGVIVAMMIFCKKNRVSLLPLADICSSIAPLGFLFGRIANFINGELYGRITDVKWAVIFPKSIPFAVETVSIPARHPSQLYEGFLEGFVLFLYVQVRFWTAKKMTPGQLSGEFLVLYSVFRIFSECFREPDATMIFGLSRGQFYSIALLILGLILLFSTRANAVARR
jgi:phosphatidylglycerol:prolipoprotein diacylglycerol transferase